jgi:D-3-phosphoglycerate dehydrogenase
LPSSLTAAVIGFGRIGRRVAELLAGVGFRVVAHDPYAAVPASAAVAPVGLGELLALADVVSLHAPGPPDGAPLLDRAAIERLKPGSVLVNTARGRLVDLAALADGLRDGRPRIAALDVFPAEPPALDAFDGVMDRVVLTPHMAWYTEESEHAMRTKAAEAARRLLVGERPEDVVVARGPL